MTKRLSEFARGLPQVEEALACKGTPLECTAFKVKKKTFLFLRAADIKFKLADSLEEAARLAKDVRYRFQIGAQGWVTVFADGGSLPPIKTLLRWVEESYRCMAPRPR